MSKLKFTKKQLQFMALVEKCDYLMTNEIDNSKYPQSMIDALIAKGAISEFKNVIRSKLI